jgi:hypothetical protein
VFMSVHEGKIPKHIEHNLIKCQIHKGYVHQLCCHLKSTSLLTDWQGLNHCHCYCMYKCNIFPGDDRLLVC